MRNKTKFKIGTTVVVLIMIAVIGFSFFLSFGGEDFRRSAKTFRSNFSGGLDRTVSVYSYNGDLIKSWTGKFDVTQNSHETYFDLNDKRVIVQGGIVINEEN